MTHLPCDRCGATVEPSSRCRTCYYSTALAFGLALVFGAGCGPAGALPGADGDCVTADSTPGDWAPLVSGNWPNELTADACNNPEGPVCYDCVNLGTGAYVRWYRADGVWYGGAQLTTVDFETFDTGDSIGFDADGTYYAFESAYPCLPAQPSE